MPRRPRTVTATVVLALLGAVPLGLVGALIGYASLGFDQPEGAVAGLLAVIAAVTVGVGVRQLRTGRSSWLVVAGSAALVVLVLVWIAYGFSAGSGDSSGPLAVFLVCPLGAAVLGSQADVRRWVERTRAAGPG